MRPLLVPVAPHLQLCLPLTLLLLCTGASAGKRSLDDGSLHQLWSTPVTLVEASGDAQELTTKLKEKLLEMASTLPDDSKSNVGGWQSTGTNLLHSEPKFFSAALKLCQDAITSHLKQSISGGGQVVAKVAASWANVNPGGAYNRMHTHPQSDLSGVLYVSCPGDAACGIELVDPRPMASAQRSESLHQSLDFGVDKGLRMKEGDVIVFPSWLSHWVPPHWDELERISIAFNAEIDFRPGDEPLQVRFRDGRESGGSKAEL
ncbi:unnamed protein product [Polarella glacialis]|uniref:Bifunctional lysine-specific demethylase and histidyl-hydroxylase n=1 Tax=Polarella glacialis TaxID=89957 RepID=A0A813K367_POLGL|nr:unnamed protein product [Polarella glacialis]CAE8625591.1 unnamed protein product [Polarella glacialis]CAE8693662.1 unnamed protein product [Polarella glacialis]CAE8694758.1 unnamed protein product [Polarella glacialis]